jgi:hypothetical protein
VVNSGRRPGRRSLERRLVVVLAQVREEFDMGSHTLIIAAAVGAALALGTPRACAAVAIPGLGNTITPQTLADQVRYRGGGFRSFGGGFRMGGFRGFGGPRISGFRAYSGPRISGLRAFGGPRVAGFRSFRGPRVAGFRTFHGPRVAGFRAVRRPFAHGRRFARFHRFRGHRFVTLGVVGAPLWWGGYGYYSGYSGCGWLRARALYTGSPYWWSRYRACLYGYDY